MFGNYSFTMLWILNFEIIFVWEIVYLRHIQEFDENATVLREIFLLVPKFCYPLLK